MTEQGALAEVRQDGDTVLFIFPLEKGCFRIAVRATEDGLLVSSSGRNLVVRTESRGSLTVLTPGDRR